MIAPLALLTFGSMNTQASNFSPAEMFKYECSLCPEIVDAAPISFNQLCTGCAANSMVPMYTPAQRNSLSAEQLVAYNQRLAEWLPNCWVADKDLNGRPIYQEYPYDPACDIHSPLYYGGPLQQRDDLLPVWRARKQSLQN